MAEVDGKVIMRSPEGKLYQVAPSDVAIAQRDQQWALADDHEVAARTAEREQYAKYGSTGQQALAAAETFARSATLGAVPGFGAPGDIEGRSQTIREESPVANFLAQAAGTAVPAIAGGALAEGVVGALGIGRAAAGVGPLLPEAAQAAATGERILGGVGALAEGAASGTADEVEEARATHRDVKVGNILMNAIPAEIIGRVVPAVARKTFGALRGIGREAGAAVEAAGEGVLGKAERKALESTADVADGVPLGPDRDVFLANADKQVIDKASQRTAESLDQLSSDFTETASGKSHKVSGLVEKTHPAQREWAAETSQGALDLREQIRPRAVEPPRPPGTDPGIPFDEGRAAPPPVSLEGRTLEDLRALPIEDASDLARVKALKENPDFAKTGRVTSNDGKQGITLVDDGGGDLVLQDGRHRLQAAQELGRDTVYGRLKDGKTGKVIFEGEIPLKASEPLPGAAPASAPRTDYGTAPGLAKPVRELDRTLTAGSEALDKASDSTEWFNTARQLHNDLVSHERKLVQAGAPEEVLAPVREYRQRLRADTERTDLWGKAGTFQQGMNRAEHDLWQKGADVEKDLGRTIGDGHRFDPSKVRSHLGKDEVGRGLTQEMLGQRLEAAEQAIATHRQFGTASESQLSRMEKNVQSVKEQLRLADDVRGAKTRIAEKEGVARESAKFDAEQAGAERERMKAEADAAKSEAESRSVLGDLAGGALGMAAGAVGHSLGLGAVVAAGTKLLRMSKLLDTLGRTGQATVGSAARGAIMGSGARALRGAARSGAVATASTAISRFQGEYPSLESAFEAKRKALDDIRENPLLLHRAVAQNFGVLPQAHPELFGEISERLGTIADYLHENLPSQMSASLTRPNGIPLSRATARDFALKYNTATNPASVFEDIKTGMASPTQIRTLEAVHPDLYQSLQLELTRAVANNPESIPTQRKIRLDILFGGDGMAGRAFAWPLAKAIKARRAERRTGSMGSPSDSLSKSAPSARGSSAIATSVTNA